MTVNCQTAVSAQVWERSHAGNRERCGPKRSSRRRAELRGIVFVANLLVGKSSATNERLVVSSATREIEIWNCGGIGGVTRDFKAPGERPSSRFFAPKKNKPHPSRAKDGAVAILSLKA
jgi:hypothetical protein